MTTQIGLTPGDVAALKAALAENKQCTPTNTSPRRFTPEYRQTVKDALERVHAEDGRYWVSSRVVASELDDDPGRVAQALGDLARHDHVMRRMAGNHYVYHAGDDDADGGDA